MYGKNRERDSDLLKTWLHLIFLLHLPLQNCAYDVIPYEKQRDRHNRHRSAHENEEGIVISIFGKNPPIEGPGKNSIFSINPMVL